MGNKAPKFDPNLFRENLLRVQNSDNELSVSPLWESFKDNFDKRILDPSNFRLKRSDAEEIFGIKVDSKTKTVDWKDNTDRQRSNCFVTYYGMCIGNAGDKGKNQYITTLGNDTYQLIRSVSEQTGIITGTAETNNQTAPVPDPVPDPIDTAQKKTEKRKQATAGTPNSIPPIGTADSTQNNSAQNNGKNNTSNSSTNSSQPQQLHVWNPLTLDELLNTPPIDFLTDNFIAKNTVNVMFAPSKSGKTYTCLSYAISMVLGTPFLGMENHLLRNVGYLNFDMFRSGFNDRMKQVIAGFNPNATPDYIDGILNRLRIADRDTVKTANGQLPDFFDLKNLEDLQLFIVTNDIEFLIIDTLSWVRGGSKINDNDEMGLTLRNAVEFFAPLNCGCLFIHHAGKNGELLGASQIIANAEFVFGLKKVNNSNKHLQLYSDTPRYSDTFAIDVYPTFKQSTTPTGATQTDSYFLSVIDPNIASNDIVDYLKSHGNSYISKTKLAMAVGNNYQDRLREIDELYTKGILERIKSGNGYKYRWNDLIVP